MEGTKKPWGGRFRAGTAKLVEAFTSSIEFDRRLYKEDIAGSMAHCRMLGTTGVIEEPEAEAILQGLAEVRDEIEAGTFPFRGEFEDIHMNIEARLREKIGPVAGKLHTARSRNDQVALDVRLYARTATVETISRLCALQETLLDLSRSHFTVVIPGYTHMQRAQPVLLAHHLLAYFEMFQRDVERLRGVHARTNVSPLGAGALAGVAYPIDRRQVAAELGFAGVTRNSIDAVADRDFVAEYIFAASLAMMHLSRLAEEIVLWSSAEFRFIELDDAYATGSSIMPQKKNPDIAELTRGKTGRVYGDLVAILTILKGLPLAYNRDMQEDKEALFDAIDTVLACLGVIPPMLATMRVNAERTMRTADESFALATDLADYLVRKGLPFRDAHGVVGGLVQRCLAQGKSFADLSLADYQEASPLFGPEVLAISVDSSLADRDVVGGTAPGQVRQAIDEASSLLRTSEEWLVHDAVR
ncbi:MAG: argininosuccinate lyase [Chloroflexota bacterium]